MTRLEEYNSLVQGVKDRVVNDLGKLGFTLTSIRQTERPSFSDNEIFPEFGLNIHIKKNDVHHEITTDLPMHSLERHPPELFSGQIAQAFVNMILKHKE